jgi:hypothetical protein
MAPTPQGQNATPAQTQPPSSDQEGRNLKAQPTFGWHVLSAALSVHRTKQGFYSDIISPQPASAQRLVAGCRNHLRMG